MLPEETVEETVETYARPISQYWSIIWPDNGQVKREIGKKRGADLSLIVSVGATQDVVKISPAARGTYSITGMMSIPCSLAV